MYVDLYLCKGTSALNNAEQFKSLINQLPITDLIKSAVKTFTILLIKLNIIVAEWFDMFEKAPVGSGQDLTLTWQHWILWRSWWQYIFDIFDIFDMPIGSAQNLTLTWRRRVNTGSYDDLGGNIKKWKKSLWHSRQSLPFNCNSHKKIHFLGPSLSKLDHKLARTNWLFCDILPTFLRLNRPFSIFQYCFVLLVSFMFPTANWTQTNWKDL